MYVLPELFTEAWLDVSACEIVRFELSAPPPVKPPPAVIDVETLKDRSKGSPSEPVLGICPIDINPASFPKLPFLAVADRNLSAVTVLNLKCCKLVRVGIRNGFCGAAYTSDMTIPIQRNILDISAARIVYRTIG